MSSGRGGPGSISFRREAMTPRGGPDGGDGGRGGNVIFRSSPRMNTLLSYRFKKKYHAENGHSGMSRNMTGPDGQDLILEVPTGTLIRDAETNEIIIDLSEPQDHLFLEGGRGGKGNWFFRTSVNQAPEKAQPGETGQTRRIKLELKLIADVGVIGYPNAGKSTFISSVSAARPKIADYPFTTLTPNLGVVRVDEERTLVVADIPGLVPGAHRGVGLGTQFLRHIERTNLFLHLIDVSGVSGRDPLQDYFDIMTELKEYDQTKLSEEEYRPLAKRQQIVALNKIDTLEQDIVHGLEARFRKAGVPVVAISAATGAGIKQLVFRLAENVGGLESELHS